MVENIKLIKASTQESIELSMLSTPEFILDSVDWGTIESTHHSFKYVNQIGVSITNTTLGTRDIEINGWIVANNEQDMSNRKMELNRFINPKEAINLLYSNYTIQFVPNTSIRYFNGYEGNNDSFVKFTIEGTCPDPLFSDRSETESVIVGTTSLFHFPLAIIPDSTMGGTIFGYRKENLITTIVNNGSVQTGIKIVFKANGTVVNPRIINADTNEQFLINKTMAQGEEIIVNTGAGERTVVGHRLNEEDSNYFAYRDIDSTWLQLAIGENTFTYAADSGVDNLDIYVYFSSKYLEVQECY